MKKLIIICVILMSIFVISGCVSELPPEPGTPGGATGQATKVYEGYSPPVDVYNNGAQIFSLGSYLYNLDFSQDTFNLPLKVYQDTGFIYQYGYFYTKSGWKKYNFDQETYAGSNWIKDLATTTLTLNKNDFYQGENYVVAYSCKIYDDIWRCGYNYVGGEGNMWMLQTFVLQLSELPPEPPAPGELTTGQIFISPNNIYVESGYEIDLRAYVNSRQDNLEEIQEPSMSIIFPEGSGERVLLEQMGVNNCELYDQDGESFYFCHVTYAGKFIPNFVGEYDLKFSSLNPLSSFEVRDASFRVVTADFYDKYLILSDISDFIFRSKSGSYWDYGDNFWASYQLGTQYVDVSVRTGKYTVSNFLDNLNANDWSKKLVGEQTVYFRSMTSEWGSFVEFAWVSGDVVVEINSGVGIDQNLDDISPVVEAYLAKHPTGQAVTGDYNLVNFPDMFIVDGNFQGQIVIGDVVPSDELLAATNIAASIGLAIGMPVNTAVTVSEVVNLDQNLILVGRPSAWTEQSNTLIDRFGYPDFFADEGGLALYPNGEYWVLVVTGYGPENVKSAARVITTDLKTGLNCKQALVAGALDSMSAVCIVDEEPVIEEVPFLIAVGDGALPSDTFIVTEVAAQLQLDSYTNVPIPELFSEVDALDLDNQVSFFVYEGDAVIVVGVNSPASHTLFASAVGNIFVDQNPGSHVRVMLSSDVETSDVLDLFASEIGCMDSDGGKNYYVKGVIETSYPNPEDVGRIISDYCLDENNLIEYFCEHGADYDPQTYLCPNGCIDGACVSDFKASGNQVILNVEGTLGMINLDYLVGDGAQFVNFGGEIDDDELRIPIGESAMTNEIQLFEGDFFIASNPETKETYVFELTNIDTVDGVEFRDVVTGYINQDLDADEYFVRNGILVNVTMVPESDLDAVTVQISNAYLDRVYTVEGREILLDAGGYLPAKPYKAVVFELDGTTTVYYFGWDVGQVVITDIDHIVPIVE